MTTTVTVHVNGAYMATVTQINGDVRQPPVTVHGNYEGSPNPSGTHSFHLPHPAAADFEIMEEYLGESVRQYVAPATDAA